MNGIEKLLTPKDVAEILGVSQKTIDRKLLCGEIPCIKVAGRRDRQIRRVSPDDLRAYLKKNRAA